ncbi:MAG: protein-export chaperone SecB [Alphaproteobacteria bacterium]
MAEKRFLVQGQYIKDLSFENPNPLTHVSKIGDKQSEMKVNLHVQTNNIHENVYEVVLDIKSEAKRKDNVIFIVELSYAGIVALENIPDDIVAPLLMIDVPAFLFPFARQIIANTTNQGGFPPLLLAPIDFGDLYEQQSKKGQNGLATADNKE